MLAEIIFYSLDKAIRRYRRMAQTNIDRSGIPITVDQWLVLRVIEESPTATQTEIAERVFKDQGSVARILALLRERGQLVAGASAQGGRVLQTITPEGQRVLAAVQPVVLANRAVALRGLTEDDLTQLRASLERIAANCSNQTS